VKQETKTGRRRLSRAAAAEISAALDGKLRPLPTKESCYAGRKQRRPSTPWLAATVLLLALAVLLLSPVGEHFLVAGIVALAGPRRHGPRSERDDDSEPEED